VNPDRYSLKDAVASYVKQIQELALKKEDFKEEVTEEFPRARTLWCDNPDNCWRTVADSTHPQVSRMVGFGPPGALPFLEFRFRDGFGVKHNSSPAHGNA
jgi:hypothetical protein